MRFHVIFYLPNGDTQKWGHTDQSWDSEFEGGFDVNQEVATAKATEALAHPRFKDHDGELHILAQTPSEEATRRCQAIRDTAESQAQTLVNLREQQAAAKKEADALAKQEARDARERAEYEKLKAKFG